MVVKFLQKQLLNHLGADGSINCIGGNEIITLLIDGSVYNIPIRFAEKYLNKDKNIIYLNKFLIKDSELINLPGYDKTSIKILSDGCWSTFSNIIKTGNRQTIIANVNNTNIVCTPDHKIIIDNEEIPAEKFYIQDNGLETVYDVINVNHKNVFVVNNNILVHNCLILDEFAFIAPSCILGSNKITIKTLSNEILKLSIEDAYNSKISGEILTPIGFKPFGYISKKYSNGYYQLVFQDINTQETIVLTLTGKHKIRVGDKFIKAAYIKCDTVVANYKLVGKQRINKKVAVYDVINVEDTHEFLVESISLHNCEEAFLASVFPVVSSSKESQIIIVSTPNGMSNEYYRIWNKAKLNIGSSDNDKWTPVEINWYDVPGRDENWKALQLATFNNNKEKFEQEYGNCIAGDTLISVYDTETDEYIEIPIKNLYQSINNIDD